MTLYDQTAVTGKLWVRADPIDQRLLLGPVVLSGGVMGAGSGWRRRQLAQFDQGGGGLGDFRP